MSLIGNTLLNEIVYKTGLSKPSEILDCLTREVRTALKQSDSQSQSNDGMDLCLVKLNQDSGILEFAGANRPMFLKKRGKIERIKGNRWSVGGKRYRKEGAFTNLVFKMDSGDAFYLTSDGFIDQNNIKRKSFGPRPFMDLLKEASPHPMHRQHEILANRLDEYQKGVSQRDDILVIGMDWFS